METVGPLLTPVYRMPRFFRWPSTRADTFSQAAILLVVLSAYFDRLTMVIAGSRLTTAWTRGMASMRFWLLPMARSLLALMATGCSVRQTTEITGSRLTMD